MAFRLPTITGSGTHARSHRSGSCHDTGAAPLKKIFSPFVLALSLTTALPAATAEEAPPASASHIQYHIPAGPLAEVLQAFGQQAGLVLIFSPQITAEIRSSGLTGVYTTIAGLSQLLGDSNIAFNLNGNTATLLPKTAAAGAANQTIEIAPLSVVDKILAGDYRDDFADSATKTFTHELDIPQPIDIINRELISAQMALDLGQTFRNSASVNVVDPLGHTNIRGFRLNENSGGILKNGLREVSQGFTFQPLANIEKIEVLKGASSALYGRGEPGGIINLITKKPRRDAFTNTTVIGGSDDFYQLNIDTNQPLTEALLFRFNAQVNDERSFRDRAEAKRQFFAPVVSYQINDTQKISAEIEINRFSQTRDQGIAAINGDIGALPRSRYLGGDTEVETSIYTLQLSHEWFINQNWALNSKFRIGQDDSDDELFNPVLEAQQQLLNNPALWGDNQARIYRTLSSADDVKDELNLDINLVGETSWQDIEHGLLFGLNINHRQVDRKSYLHYNEALYTSLSGINPALAFYGAVSFVDPFNPENPESIFLPAGLGLLNPAFANEFAFTDKIILQDTKTDILSSGIYIQDQIRLNDHWQLLLGARYDYNVHKLDDTRLNIPAFLGGQVLFTPRVDAKQSDGEWVPRAGIVYQPTDSVSLYASYARQYDIALVAADVRPVESDSREYGIKWNITDKLNASIAYFDIRKTNVVDPSNLLVPDVVDEVESSGYEASLLGRISPHWAVSANFSDFEAEISKDANNPSHVGNRARGTPTRSGSLWLKYDAQPFGQTGVGIALGVNHVGARPGDNGNSFDLPSYTLWDTTLTYKTNTGLGLRLQLENLTNKRWYSGAYNSQSIFVGHGSRARLAVDYQF
ncbi:MAG: TonB-dependent receptor [Porticoccaceae bacterium]|nr:TonB-dependent receptor [Porticoccaceae bacterium]